jgi:hypothetical protein
MQMLGFKNNKLGIKTLYRPLRFESSLSYNFKLCSVRFATELVLISMGMLPSVMPPHFNNTYTPIAAAGTDAQVNHTRSGRAIGACGNADGQFYRYFRICYIWIESLQILIQTFLYFVSKNCPILLRTLKTFMSSRDAVHLGQEKNTCRQDSLSKWIC